MVDLLMGIVLTKQAIEIATVKKYRQIESFLAGSGAEPGGTAVAREGVKINVSAGVALGCGIHNSPFSIPA